MAQFTTIEVAKRLGVTRQNVLYHIGKGTLPALQLGRDWIIEEADIAKIKGLKRGRKNKSLPKSKKRS